MKMNEYQMLQGNLQKYISYTHLAAWDRARKTGPAVLHFTMSGKNYWIKIESDLKRNYVDLTYKLLGRATDKTTFAATYIFTNQQIENSQLTETSSVSNITLAGEDWIPNFRYT